MSGQLLHSFRQGNRSEYLAAYLLSSLGTAVKVPREEDVGIDFHCNLASNFGNGLLSFFAPYNVQIKSASSVGARIKYGGNKDGKSHVHEVRWLLSQTTPFFIGLVDKRSGEIRIYSTATRWFIKWSDRIPLEVVFVADSPDSNTHIGNGRKVALEGSDIPPDLPPDIEPVSWELPLGQPAITLDSEQAEDPNYLLNIRGNFKDYIYLDERNSVFAGMGLTAFYWPLVILPNQTLMAQGISVGWGNKVDHRTHRQMSAFAPLVASLQRTYLETGDISAAQKFDGLIDLIPDTDVFKLVRQMISDSTAMAATKTIAGTPSLSAGKIIVSTPNVDP